MGYIVHEFTIYTIQPPHKMAYLFMTLIHFLSRGMLNLWQLCIEAYSSNGSYIRRKLKNDKK